MRKTLCLLTAVSALCMAGPAAAQYRDYRGGYGADASFDARIDSLQARLDAGLRAGTITSREGWMLRRQIRDLRRVEARYSMNGFSPWERSDLNARLRSVRQEIRVADNNSWDRYDRFSWDGRYTGRGGPLDDKSPK